MKTLSRLLIALLILLASCSEQNDVNTSACTGGLQFFQESFEGYALGPLPREDRWGYEGQYQQVSVINTGCAVGSKCIQMKAHIPPPGDLFSIFHGCYKKGAPFYSQFYVKYTVPPGNYLVAVSASSTNPDFAISLSNHDETTIGDHHFILGKNYFTFDTWYRFEIRVSTEPVTLDFAIYQGTNTTPLDKFTSVNIDKYAYEGRSAFSYGVGYSGIGPSSDDYLYIDDFAISNDPSILKVGF